MAKPKCSKPSPTCYYFYLLITTRSPSPSPSHYTSRPFLKSPRRPPTVVAPCPPPTLFFLAFFVTISTFLLTTFPVPPAEIPDAAAPSLAESAMVPLPVRSIRGNLSEEEREFWKQPDGRGYRPCIRFSLEYRKASRRVVAEERRFVVVLVSGGLNQQRNEIVDAVVIARILGAALVVPSLRANAAWNDESEFEDVFDLDHFRTTLRSDIRVVSSLPVSHKNIRSSPIGGQIPFNASPFWIRRKLLPELNRDGLLVLKGLNSKLTTNLPSDLQKLRCKVAYHALRFAPQIDDLANRLVLRMWKEGTYVGVHLRLERDVWVRTGCLTGLGPEYDGSIVEAQRSHQKLLTGRLQLPHLRRRLAGLCPLNAHEVAMLLVALGAPRTARLYLAGGEPFGGEEALKPLVSVFPNVERKDTLAVASELEGLANKSSAMAAVDFVVALSGDVFLASHGGNMGRALEGYRMYAGHRKTVRPNKHAVAQLLEGGGLTGEELRAAARRMLRAGPRGSRDVIAEPMRECMCRRAWFDW